jgi:hypothetical protein
MHQGKPVDQLVDEIVKETNLLEFAAVWRTNPPLK